MKTSRCVQGISLSTGAGVKVAVLDSGVNPASLGTKFKAPAVYDCQASLEGLAVRKLAPGLAADRNGHGTVVHGCVLAVAPDAAADHFRILDENNQCESTLLCYVLDHVIDAGYKVINLSLGTRNEDCVPWLVSIMKRAYEAGALVVASASNVGNSLYPSRFTYCVSVEAAALGDPLGLKFHTGSVVEFGGHGIEVEVRNGQGNMESVTGSSYAAAHVTGLCARILEVRPDATPLDVKLILREYALSRMEQCTAS